MPTVADNLARVRERIDLATQRAGRQPNEVKLVGVCKYVSAMVAAELAAAGCCDLGESRPQELWRKAVDPAFGDQDIRWHMIGHLQRNKVTRTVPIAAMIHSIDSPRLLQAVNDAATANHSTSNVLLEVNCSGEAGKHGFAPDALREFASKLVNYPAVEICGLMTMAAGNRSLDSAAANFATLRQLRDELSPLLPANIQLNELSMGMSGDFEIAIAEGATMVRVGSALWEGTA